ncbi:hypothetical protein MTYP_02376 [Methylophilaceae bacterium]|nr:hypothetical protein MTYP_02376 [Methylophilaceae bacterium]
MNTTPCKRIVLSGSDGCRVSYCEDCRVAEIEVGALSLRLEVHAFNTLADVLQEAAAKLAAFNAARADYEREVGSQHVH